MVLATSTLAFAALMLILFPLLQAYYPDPRSPYDGIPTHKKICIESKHEARPGPSIIKTGVNVASVAAHCHVGVS